MKSWVLVLSASLLWFSPMVWGKAVLPHQAIYDQASRAFVSGDFAQVLKLLRPLALNQNDAVAQYNLAVLYQDGLGVPMSPSKAFRWYHKAARNGQVEAQFELGLAYAQGEGVQQNYQKSVFWYQKASEQGHAQAQNNLAMRYASGTGVKQDMEKARYWFERSAMAGHEPAIANLRALQQEMMKKKP